MENDNPPTPPPLYNAPPPLVASPPPPARARRRGRGWMVLALVLAVLLVLSWATSIFRSVGLSASTHQRKFWLEEVVLDDKGAPDKLAVIEVSGLISSEPWDGSGQNMVESIEKQLKVAAEDKAVKAVILKVNSPGGEVMASDDISRAITDFQKKSSKPVIASMGSLAASGGYYVSAPCDWIVANDLTITGSIGVIMPSYNYRKLLDKIGVRPEVYKSGKFKDMLSGSKADNEILPEERQLVQSLIDETFKKFKTVVGEGRGGSYRKNKAQGARDLSPEWESLADGRILTGRQAYDNGFVDEVGNFDSAVERAKTLARISRANVIHYEQPFSLGNLFRLFGETKARGINLDLGMDLPKLKIGQLYFLSSTVLL
jgi:protease-4